MKKFEEALRPTSCWSRALPNELIFVVLGRDKAAAETIRFWVGTRLRLGLNSLGDAQIVEALELAEKIEHALYATRSHVAREVAEDMSDKKSPAELRKLGLVEPAEGTGERLGRDALAKMIEEKTRSLTELL